MPSYISKAAVILEKHSHFRVAISPFSFKKIFILLFSSVPYFEKFLVSAFSFLLYFYTNSAFFFINIHQKKFFFQQKTQ